MTAELSPARSLRQRYVEPLPLRGDLRHHRREDALVIEALAHGEAFLRERVVDLACERASYQLLAKRAIHALHDLTVRHGRQQDRYHRLVDEYRAFRERVMRESSLPKAA